MSEEILACTSILIQFPLHRCFWYQTCGSLKCKSVCSNEFHTSFHWAFLFYFFRFRFGITTKKEILLICYLRSYCIGQELFNYHIHHLLLLLLSSFAASHIIVLFMFWTVLCNGVSCCAFFFVLFCFVSWKRITLKNQVILYHVSKLLDYCCKRN